MESYVRKYLFSRYLVDAYIYILHNAAVCAHHGSVHGQPVRPDLHPEAEKVRVEVSAAEPDARVRVETAANAHRSQAHVSFEGRGFSPGS